ncbi:MAG: HAMP domain-containing sensor histidine kinase [Gammaproteobacteria bacterium]
MRNKQGDVDYQSLSELREHEKLEEIRSIIATITSRLVLPLYFLFWACDLIYVPEYKWEFLGLRSLVIPFALVTHYMITRTNDVRHANYIALFYVFSLAVVINTMIYIVGDIATPYYAGLNLIAIGTLAFIPWTPRYFALVVMVIFVPYYAIELNLIFSENMAYDGLIIASFFIVATVIISGVVRYFYEQMRLRELQTRLDLQLEIKRRQEMEKEVVFARDNALAASASKSTFLANMSHELRTPLHAIIGYSELLQDQSLGLEDKQANEDVKKIETAGRHLLSIINNILDIVKLETGRLDADIDIFHVREIVEITEQIARPLASKNNNQLIVECPDTIGVMESDGIKLKQILINIIGNACKFTTDGTITLTVSGIDLEDQGWVQFVVRDTGVGMSPIHTKRVFDAFAQADSSTTRKYGGTGLGLAISKQFCKLLGGDITVHSELGKGSVFTVFLPRIVRENSTYDRNLRNFNHRRNRAASVFVLANQDMMRQKLQVMLIDKGFDANGASFDKNGVEASAVVSPDVIICSAAFEDSAIQQLYNQYCDYQYASIPVILVKMNDSDDSGSMLCYHEYFPNMPFLSLVNLYENTQQKGLILLSQETRLATSLTQAHNIHEAITCLNKAAINVVLLDPKFIASGKAEQLSKFFTTIYQSNIRLALINPNQAGYKGFLDNMRALMTIVEKMKSDKSDISKQILDSVVSMVRKDATANILDIRSSYNEVSVAGDKVINETA